MTAFNSFSEIKHFPLRVFNRTVYFYNLLKDEGKETALEYLELFSDQEKVQMNIMSQLIALKGVKDVRAMVTEGATFPYDPATEV